MRQSKTTEVRKKQTDEIAMELKLGSILSKILRERRITLKEVSKNCSVAISTLHEWENGRAPKNPEQVARVADFLGVSLHYLLFGLEDRQNPIARIFKEDVFQGTFEVTVRKVRLPNGEGGEK